MRKEIDTESLKVSRSSLPFDESELLQQMAGGDSEAFDRLYRHYQPKVSQYIYPFTLNTNLNAEDIVQDIFVKLWMKREIVVSVISLEFYLYRMARNRLIDLIRSSKKQQAHYKEFTDSQSFDAETTAYDFEFREFQKKAQDAIAALPDRRRQIFNLSVNYDLSVKQIADYMKLSASVVKKQLYLATNQVKKFIRSSNTWLPPVILILHITLIS